MLQEHLVADLLELESGFDVDGQRWHCVCIGIKGDLPFLAKSGGMYRHWLRAVKTSANVNPVGVCWMCRAGESGIGFEDFNMSSAWASLPNTKPWKIKPYTLKLLHCESDPAQMWRPDIWHCFHGGAGKTFIASCLTECLFLFEGSKDVKIEKLAAELRL